jgi:hypothetical protein
MNGREKYVSIFEVTAKETYGVEKLQGVVVTTPCSGGAKAAHPVSSTNWNFPMRFSPVGGE